MLPGAADGGDDKALGQILVATFARGLLRLRAGHVGAVAVVIARADHPPHKLPVRLAGPPRLLDARHGLLRGRRHLEHHEVRGVEVVRAVEALALEVFHEILRGPVETDLAGLHDQQVVELREDLRRRLVQGHEDRHAGLREHLHGARHRERVVGIQAAQGLVHEQHPRVGDELHADGHALLLTAGETLVHGGADASVGAILEAQALQHLVDVGLPPGGADGLGQPQARGEVEAFPGRLGLHECDVLEDISDLVAEELLSSPPAVDADLPRKSDHQVGAARLLAALGALPAGQHVQQCGFTAARWAQHAGELARLDDAGNTLEDLLIPEAEADVLPLQRKALVFRPHVGPLQLRKLTA
mmetsp:Transcript_24552/g.71040  ORF Transcript_24552/g.71040 Transcript_24552/m.71040 type:complete len:358 (+) Transcript_24552:547-1620(+)